MKVEATPLLHHYRRWLAEACPKHTVLGVDRRDMDGLFRECQMQEPAPLAEWQRELLETVRASQPRMSIQPASEPRVTAIACPRCDVYVPVTYVPATSVATGRPEPGPLRDLYPERRRRPRDGLAVRMHPHRIVIDVSDACIDGMAERWSKPMRMKLQRQHDGTFEAIFTTKLTDDG